MIIFRKKKNKMVSVHMPPHVTWVQISLERAHTIHLPFALCHFLWSFYSLNLFSLNLFVSLVKISILKWSRQCTCFGCFSLTCSLSMLIKLYNFSVIRCQFSSFFCSYMYFMYIPTCFIIRFVEILFLT